MFNDEGGQGVHPERSAFQSPLHRGLVFNEVKDDEEFQSATISVPSSSGTRVQLGVAIGTDAAPAQFQSPLHRGLVFNLASPSGLMPPQPNFSPLFIGDSCSTHRSQRKSSQWRYISVPSSSGTRVQRRAVTAQAFQLGMISVPSSSGTRVQLVFPRRQRQLKLISVPSSSGTRVQPCTLLNAVPISSYFSPLFIGDSCSTINTAVGPPPVNNFSPLFIGDSCSTRSGAHPQRYRQRHFSPLFIGDSCSTLIAYREHFQLRFISVPSSSGTRVQLALPTVSKADGTLFQSPLHRGLVFNVCVPSSGLPVLLEFQSPLHRGLVFNATIN